MKLVQRVGQRECAGGSRWVGAGGQQAGQLVLELAVLCHLLCDGGCDETERAVQDVDGRGWRLIHAAGQRAAVLQHRAEAHELAPCFPGRAAIGTQPALGDVTLEQRLQGCQRVVCLRLVQQQAVHLLALQQAQAGFEGPGDEVRVE
ncbi:MAG: hypothetical protein U1B84_19740, partial [Variovorax sp.]|nr:hypothetical protein [Variovorax sp.]